MKKVIISVNYLIEGELIALPTKMVYKTKFNDDFNEEELEYVHFEVEINHKLYVSQSSDVSELAVKHLQRELPEVISIVSCISCRHGNFCPFGDNDNEIFCFKDMKFNNKLDVVVVFSKQDTTIHGKSRMLLDYCKDYKPILKNGYYTYNDWGL